MKKYFLILFMILFSFSIFSQSEETLFLTRKYQGIAIGQLTLAHRLISLATSLAISQAVEKDYILSLLQNIDSTIDNSKKIITANNNNPDKFTVEILKAIDFFVKCSDNVKEYSKNHNYDSLSNVRSCVENSSAIIDKLTDTYNSKDKKKTKKPHSGKKKKKITSEN